MFPLHPELFEIESQTKEEHLRSHIGLAAREEPSEGKVGFEQGESAPDLNGTAHTQRNPARGADVVLRLGALFPERTVPLDFFGCICVFCSAAEAALRAMMAAFASVPCRGHGLAR